MTYTNVYATFFHFFLYFESETRIFNPHYVLFLRRIGCQRLKFQCFQSSAYGHNRLSKHRFQGDSKQLSFTIGAGSSNLPSSYNFSESSQKSIISQISAPSCKHSDYTHNHIHPLVYLAATPYHASAQASRKIRCPGC